MKLLIVTETGSIHAARWVNQLSDTGWDVHVFQAVVGRAGIHPEFKFGIFHVPTTCSAPKGSPLHVTLPQDRGILEELAKIEARIPGVLQHLHEQYLQDLIQREKPDVVHSLGLNISWTNMCLPVLRVRESMGDGFDCPWLYSSWGTDLSFYCQLSERNLSDVRSVLKGCDYLITEHSHDRNRAYKLGFGGEFLGYFTGFGGIENEELERKHLQRTSKRKAILLKGRDVRDGDPIGRAATAIRALRLCQDVARDYRIVVASAPSSGSLVEEIATLTATTDLRVQVLPYVSSEHLMEIYGASRLFISLTVNDGIPRSLLEAMACGAFPIVSDLDSFSDIIVNGETGLLVPPEDPVALAQALRNALSNDSMVDNGAYMNHEIIRHEFSDTSVKPRVLEMYSSIARGVGQRPATRKKSSVSDAKDELLMRLISQAVARSSVTCVGLIRRGVENGSAELLEPIGDAMKLNNERVYDLLGWGMARNDEMTLRLLEKALRNNGLMLRLLKNGLVCKCVKLMSLSSRYFEQQTRTAPAP